MRDQILAKLMARKLAKGPNRWTEAGQYFLYDFVELPFSVNAPTLYAEKLAEQLFNLFGPSARIVIDPDPNNTSNILARLAAEEPKQ